MTPHAFIELIHAVWYQVTRNGGEAVRDWRGEMGADVDLAYWNDGSFAGVRRMPELAVFLSTDAGSREQAQARARTALSLGARVCWVMNVEDRSFSVLSNAAPLRSVAGGTLTDDSVPGLRVRLEEVFG